jgi:hypothetical protein
MTRPAMTAWLVATGLAATLAWEAGAFAPSRRAAPAHPSASADAPPQAAAPDHTLDWVATILARPLLSPDRRPPPEAVAAAPGALVTDGLPRLSGVLVGPFGRTAIFAAEAAKPVVVGEGGRVDAWTVRRIEAGEVQVAGPGGVRTVHPSFPASGAEPGRAAAPGQRVGLSLAR